MKVFDLHCPLDHVFEGWFASEEDFRSQLDRGLVECPMCGSKELRKGLSAPRLNLGAQPAAAAPAPVPDETDRRKLHALQAAWLEVSRKIAAKTEDVGERFAEEALRMHKGEEPERPIRGQATPQQAMELLEEGVPVMPWLCPRAARKRCSSPGNLCVACR